MRSPFLERMQDEVLVCDGAMGTMLHAAGVSLDRSLPELNLTDAALVRSIHQDYIARGARIIQTNTFGASRLRLRVNGLEERVAEINLAGVEVARAAAAGGPVLVAGSVGPVAAGALRARVTPTERLAAIDEQVRALLEGGVDLLIFETFVDLNEMVQAVKVARALGDVPVVAQMTFVEDGRTISGDTPEEVALTLTKLGVDVIGVNCSLGPQGVLQVLRQLSRHTDLPLSAQPNASQARLAAEGRFTYQVDEAYFARQALRYVEMGASVVGGCCGTTPRHTASVAETVRGLRPSRRRRDPRAPAGPALGEAGEAADQRPAGLAGRLAAGEFVAAVEIHPSGGGDVEAMVRAAQRVLEAGIDLIAIASGPTARAQVSPISAALLLQQRLPVQAMVSMTTWDRSIMALQADLLGAHSCGVRTVICRTGVPPLQGDYPNLDGIWDVDSIGLLRLLHALNQGRDYHGTSIRIPTSFTMGARVNPGALEMEHELRRAQLKVAAGAHFLVTEPAYDLAGVRLLAAGLDRARPPILLGLRPLADYTEAEYLRHEVPDATIPAAVLERMRRAGDRGRQAGLEICRELLAEAAGLVQGVVLTLEDPEVDFGQVLPAATYRAPRSSGSGPAPR